MSLATRGEAHREPLLNVRNLCVAFHDGEAWYEVLKDVSFTVEPGEVIGNVGESGCGKSLTALSIFRVLPRHGARLTGEMMFEGRDLAKLAEHEMRDVRGRRISMVFQKPNPFPKSIVENVAYGLRINGMAGSRPELAARVEESLKQAALWDEVKDRLHESALAMSGGQQQRLCIARALAVRPDILLMDEPASALDPIATQRIEELVYDLKRAYTIVIVTHNMQQAARVADMTAFFSVDVNPDGGRRSGILVEYDSTAKIFTTPADKRTEDYVTGRFG